MNDAADILLRETGCTPVQAQAAIAALVNIGWQAPALRPPPGSAYKAVASLVLRGGGHLIAHTDGACSGNPGPGGWAVVFSQDGKVVGELSGGEGRSTNNQMELTAIREAIRLAPTNVSLEIITDSKNAIGWLSENWKRNDPKIKAIASEIDHLRVRRASAADGPGKITFTYVRGHNGKPLNERADLLATGAIPRIMKHG